MPAPRRSWSKPRAVMHRSPASGRAGRVAAKVVLSMATAVGLWAIASYAYDRTHPESSGPFPSQLLDVTLVTSSAGEAAMAAVKGLHRNDPAVQIDRAYTASYAGATGRQATIWISGSRTSAGAASLFSAMDDTVGASGMFSEPSSITVADTRVAHVTDRDGGHHYFYERGPLVVWIRVDGPDEAYRQRLIAEAVRRIGEASAQLGQLLVA